MNCGEALAKYILIILNVIFFLCGITIITIGAIVTAQDESISALVSNGVWAVSITIIVVGCIVTLVTLFGCCGATRENSCMLYTYATILGIIFAVEMAGAILIFCYKDDATQIFTDQLRKSMDQYGENSATTNAWDHLQQMLKCCGAQNSTDWGTKIPVSCCTAENIECDPLSSEIYEQGCVEAVVDFIKTNINIVGGVAIGVAVVEVFGVVFACCIASAAKKR